MFIPLHPRQIEFIDSGATYRAFVGGRGSGKSWAGCYDLIRRAKRNRTYTVADPTSVMSRDDTFPRFKAMAQSLGVWGGVRMTPYPDVALTTGAVVRFRTADEPDRMRGPDISGFWLNEASFMHEDAYKVAIACLREEGRMGWLSATFTPQGPLHWTHEVFNTGKPDTAIFKARTMDNPFNPPEFAATLARQYGDSPYAMQELGGEFISLEGATFPAHWLPESILVPAWPEGVTRQVLYTDPSQGKDSKSGDAQAHCRAGFWPGAAKQNLIYLLCHAHREDPPAMVARGVRLCREQRVDLWAYEVTGTLGFLEAEVNRQVKESSLLIRTWPHNNTDPKAFRIRGALMPYLARGQIRIVDTPGGRQLRNELLVHPSKDAHDDCADAAAGAVSYLEQLVGGG